MKFDKNDFLGARIKGKNVDSLRYKGHTIYPIFIPEDAYKNYYTMEFRPTAINNYENGYGAWIQQRNCSNNDYELETNWGDGTINSEEYHLYSAPGTIDFSSNGFPSLRSNDQDLSLGYWVVAVNYIRPDIVDGSALFSSHFNLTTERLYLPETSHMTKMRGMFSSCESLTSLNLSSFSTNKVESMAMMFYRCESLTELNLSNFNTSNVWGMNYMFSSCANLTELDLSNFNMENVTYTDDMFKNCNALHILRLDNCSNDTISKIIDSTLFPINTIEGITRKIYVNPNNIDNLTPPENWVFVNCETNEVIN